MRERPTQTCGAAPPAPRRGAKSPLGDSGSHYIITQNSSINTTWVCLSFPQGLDATRGKRDLEKKRESLCRLTVAAGKPPETPNCELRHLLPVPREPSRQPHPLNFQVKIAVNKDSFKTNSDQDSSEGVETGELFILLILSTSGQAHCFT